MTHLGAVCLRCPHSCRIRLARRPAAELWNELHTHVALVTTVVGAVNRIRLAGSFVSGKLDPSDVDLAYLIAPEAFDSIAMAPGDDEVFQQLGLYDEIWQRCRTGSSAGRRGYVEVTL
ncbi:DUF6932 family protein [Streptomyces sp. NPDC058280]|uniref:DUF6932 family protein n=1 Tax=Streptomyces sp. NPDC058280 TaxID=3346419 RepID=UPI0036E4DDE4